MARKQPEWLGISQNGQEEARNLEINQNRQKQPEWPGIRQNGPESARMAREQPKWPAICQNGHKSLYNSQEPARMAKKHPEQTTQTQRVQDKLNAKAIMNFQRK